MAALTGLSEEEVKNIDSNEQAATAKLTTILAAEKELLTQVMVAIAGSSDTMPGGPIAAAILTAKDEGVTVSAIVAQLSNKDMPTWLAAVITTEEVSGLGPENKTELAGKIDEAKKLAIEAQLQATSKELEAQTSAVVKAQSAYRGYQVRKQFKSAKERFDALNLETKTPPAKLEIINNEIDALKQSGIDIKNPLEKSRYEGLLQKAKADQENDNSYGATKIQSLWRGFFSRKKTSTEKTDPMVTQLNEDIGEIHAALVASDGTTSVDAIVSKLAELSAITTRMTDLNVEPGKLDKWQPLVELIIATTLNFLKEEKNLNDIGINKVTHIVGWLLSNKENLDISEMENEIKNLLKKDIDSSKLLLENLNLAGETVTDGAMDLISKVDEIKDDMRDSEENFTLLEQEEVSQRQIDNTEPEAYIADYTYKLLQLADKFQNQTEIGNLLQQHSSIITLYRDAQLKGHTINEMGISSGEQLDWWESKKDERRVNTEYRT